MKLPAHKKMLSAAAAASVMLLTAACGSGSDDASSGTPSSSSTSSSSSDDTSDASASTYKDGDYDAEGSYSNPGGQSTVEVELTLADNKITKITVTPEAENATSKQYQTKFAGGISDEVVGKSLDDLDVSKVAGSSLTSSGFNAAIDEIKADAKA